MEFIQNFKIIQKLGSGGQGDVYLAKYSKHKFKFNRLVALKVINKTSATIDEFSNEVEILAKLHHPKICQIYDVGEIEKSYFIVMEYIDGLSFSDFMKKAENKKIIIESADIVEILTSVISALRYAHQSEIGGVLHRDVCPKNIMISKSGEVVLIDFGISNILLKEKDSTLKGKPSYLPKQVLLGNSRYSEKTDIYAAGVVLYEALTGTKILHEDEINLESIKEEELRVLTKCLLNFDGDYDQLFQMMEDYLVTHKSQLHKITNKVFNTRFLTEQTQRIRSGVQFKGFGYLFKKTSIMFAILLIAVTLTSLKLWKNYEAQKSPMSFFKGKFIRINPLTNEEGIDFNDQLTTTLTIKSKTLVKSSIDEKGCKSREKWTAYQAEENVVEFRLIEPLFEKSPLPSCEQMSFTKAIETVARIEFRRDGNYLYLRKLSGSSRYLDKQEKYQAIK